MGPTPSPLLYRTVATRDDGLRVVLVEKAYYEHADALAKKMHTARWSYTVEQIVKPPAPNLGAPSD